MKEIRIGAFGAWRGANLAKECMLLGAKVVALCDNNKDRANEALKTLGKGVTLYDDFDKFIEHPMDAVILGNNFYEHAPFAIKCFEKNLHVLSECIANVTMKEGVMLARAFEKSKSIYVFSENYTQMVFNLEMKKVVEEGKLGKILYAEGEYNHPFSEWDTNFTKKYIFYPKHWRNYIPATYYITHSLAPIMYITGATPKKVSAFPMYAPFDKDVPSASYVGDRSANITTLNDDGSVFRMVGWGRYGAHHNSYRVCGVKGQIENLRGMGKKVMLRYNEWDTPEGEKPETLYEPSWNDKDEELIKRGGHEGGDFMIARLFLDCIKNGKQPPHALDIYSAINMSSVAILGHYSVLNGGKVYDIPDFRKEEDRKLYENDDLTPFYGSDGSEPTLPCCSNPNYKPTEKNMELYLKELEK